MGRPSKKRARKSPNASDNNNSVITYSPCSATPLEGDNVEIGLTPHLMLDGSVFNLIVSSTSRSKSIDNIKSELNTVFKQLTDMRSKVQSLASSLSKHDDLKQEIKTISPLKLLLSKDIVPAELDDIIKAKSYPDIPTRNANLPVMSVVTSDSQCTSNEVTNPILPSLPLEAHKQVLSSNA
ncbi:unnamed protein product, partial [Schistosoma curassoni]|uniref:BLOC-1-related complex subunit 5 n=1 Tax=Schistosoma curassoni TaxID=6186 RepID=A0A183L763_9TREM